jgi:alpha-glucoside transport system permease protein
MSVIDKAPPSPPEAPATESGGGGSSSGPRRTNGAKLLLGLLGMGVVLWFLLNLFLAFAYYPQWFASSKILIGLIALVAGVGGAYLFFYCLNVAVEGLPERLSIRAMPYAYLLPGFAMIGVMLLYPTIQTINYSFANAESTEYIGFANYREIFSDSEFWVSITNNLLWLIVVPAFVVAFGVVVAVLSDKMSARGEKFTKALIFLPMAISMVAASAIWAVVYELNVSGAQVGPLNAIWTSLGGNPVAWLDISTARLNSFLMMVVLIWLQVGFAMILLSSAIKGVPEDTIEAARIDGATEWQIFWQVVIPQIKGTIITVYVTQVILVLKVFDIVYVIKGYGRDKTNVIANLFFQELFANDQAGKASAIVVVLLVAITPVLIYQVKLFREEEASR